MCVGGFSWRQLVISLGGTLLLLMEALGDRW
jgi:hypothetical protein